VKKIVIDGTQKKHIILVYVHVADRCKHQNGRGVDKMTFEENITRSYYCDVCGELIDEGVPYELKLYVKENIHMCYICQNNILLDLKERLGEE